MNTFSGLKNANEKFYPYLSTSHYLRSAMGTEKTGKYDDPTGMYVKLFSNMLFQNMLRVD